MENFEEDVTQDTGTPDDVTTTEDSVPDETLAPEISDQEISEEQVSPEEQDETHVFDPEAEQVIEFNGKTYTVKGSELQNILESHQALAERERNQNRDYTQKTQALAEERKSIEQAFGGRMPEPQEMQAMGKLFNAYFQDEQVAKVVNAIIEGQPLEQVMSAQPAQGEGPLSPEVSALSQEIRGLKAQLNQFVSGTEQEKQNQQYAEGKRIFDSWMQGKAQKGESVDETIIDSVLETAKILLRRNPSMDKQKALDEAYRRETIDQVQQDATKKVLVKADQAKKQKAIKITPKAPVKQEDSSYATIFQSAM